MFEKYKSTILDLAFTDKSVKEILIWKYLENLKHVFSPSQLVRQHYVLFSI